MRISTKGRYALRLMLDLAMNEENGLVTIKDISERQGVSDKYLERIISSLKKAGYVESVRGAQGGYKLIYPIEKYTVGMILRATEGNLAPVDCIETGSCDRADKCMTIKLWSMINDAVNNVIDNVTLKDLIDWKNE